MSNRLPTKTTQKEEDLPILSTEAIKRLAIRGGILRIQKSVYDYVLELINQYLHNVILKSSVLMKLEQSKTLMPRHVEFSLPYSSTYLSKISNCKLYSSKKKKQDTQTTTQTTTQKKRKTSRKDMLKTKMSQYKYMIKQYNCVEFAKATFKRLIKKIFSFYKPEYLNSEVSISENAHMLLQLSLEQYVVDIFKKSYHVLGHTKRDTLIKDDLELVYNLCYDNLNNKKYKIYDSTYIPVNFKRYNHKILKSIDKDIQMSTNAAEQLDLLLKTLATNLVLNASNIAKSINSKTLLPAHIMGACEINFDYDLYKYVNKKVYDTLEKYNKSVDTVTKKTSKAERAEINIAPSRVRHIIEELWHGRISNNSSIVLASILNSVSEQILISSIETTIHKKRKTINVAYLKLGVDSDKEIKELVNNVGFEFIGTVNDGGDNPFKYYDIHRNQSKNKKNHKKSYKQLDLDEDLQQPDEDVEDVEDVDDVDDDEVYNPDQDQQPSPPPQNISNRRIEFTEFPKNLQQPDENLPDVGSPQF